MKRLVRLGTRGSTLALRQTEDVRALLEEAEPACRFQTVVINCTGDRLYDRPLPEIGGKGLFTAELERALRDRSIDLAVHSLKDLPTETPEDLVLGAVLARIDPSDALVSRDGHTLASLPSGALIGTSSTRRRAQILAFRPDLTVLDIRGNVDTRLRKVRDGAGPYDAAVIAYAALARLGEVEAVTEMIAEEVMLPAPGQGALAVQCRSGVEFVSLLRSVNDIDTEIETRAERAFLAALEGGCAVPVAARCRVSTDGRVQIKGRICSLDGRRRIDVIHDMSVGAGAEGLRQAEEAGRALAAAAMEKGAGEILGTRISGEGAPR